MPNGTAMVTALDMKRKQMAAIIRRRSDLASNRSRCTSEAFGVGGVLGTLLAGDSVARRDLAERRKHCRGSKRTVGPSSPEASLLIDRVWSWWTLSEVVWFHTDALCRMRVI